MTGIWDSNLKRLVGGNPQHFLMWLLPGAQYIRELSAHLNRNLDIDILHEVLLDGERVGFHLEFQRNKDVDMAKRVLEYNVFASCKFDCTVVSFVLYLKKENKIVEPPLIRTLPNGREILRLNFTNIKLWEVPTDELRRTGLVGLLPLFSLTREGGIPEIVEEAITGIQHSTADDEAKANLLSITLTLAALAFDRQEDREWLIRRFQMLQDILRDTDIYQMIAREGREEGLEALRQILLDFIQARFPKLLRFATKQTSDVTDVKLLRFLISEIGLSQITEEEARQLLINLDNENIS